MDSPQSLYVVGLRFGTFEVWAKDNFLGQIVSDLLREIQAIVYQNEKKFPSIGM
mgnify:CR=1 FL=1